MRLRSPYWLFVVLILALAGLQYRLWVGDGSLAQVRDLQKQIADQHGENERLLERNRILEAEVAELKKGTETVEERARHELGMVKDGETSTSSPSELTTLLPMTTSDLPAFWTVIPAAGVGSRMRADRPKQYLDLAGRTVIERTLDCFLEHPMLRGLVVCLAEDDPYWPGLDCAASRHVQRAAGGAERAGSVLNGLLRLLELGAQADDWVLVHDAARPNLTRGDLDRLLEELAEDPVGGLLAVPARDTLKRSDRDGRVSETIDRSVVWLAYTPQMFRLGALHRALADALVAGVAITDEASAMEWAGYAPKLVEGRADNLKITTPEDLLRLQRSFPH